MDPFIAQRGDYCLLTADGYVQLMESPRFLPVGLAAWAPENDSVVGYIEGETVYRLVDERQWLKVLKDCRQRALDVVLADLRRRGLYLPGPEATHQN
jgi:hypothetical protein